MNLPFQIILLLAAFLAGSIPFGLLIARIFKVGDLTKKGSGNIGATNVSRVVGFWPAGFLTFALDLLKGAVPILLVSETGLADGLAGLLHHPDASDLVSPLLIWAMGLAAVLGHCFSPWIQFKGGKGVATGLGVIAVLSPVAAIAGIVGFVCSFFMTKTSSLSSMTGLTVAAAAYIVIHGPTPQSIMGAALITVILIRHEGNLDALLEDRERVFK